MSSQLDTLTNINLDDLVASFGWENHGWAAAFLRRMFARPARKFAGQIVEYDKLVGRVGLHEASRATLQGCYIHDLKVRGQENIPTRGPALFLSNHPGLADTISLFAAIPREDLRIIALQRPFLASLPNITRHLFYISDDAAEKMRAVRQVSAHLRAGGAVLTFPSGKIEPDPDVHPGALESLQDWTDSSAVFLRFAPELQIVPVLVSGVIWERTARFWLTRIKRRREERERLAAALQLLAMVVRNTRPTTVHVHFGRPITRQETGSTNRGCVHKILMERMHCLIENRGNEEGTSVL